MINEFKGQFRFLSNFYPSPMLLGGIRYPTLEHAFQAYKTTDMDERARIAALPKPGQAKRAGRNLTLRPDWEDIKVNVMCHLLVKKFSDPNLRVKLLATAEQKLVEGNTWGDTFWGVDLRTGRGENWLGKLLSNIREQLQS